MKKIFFITSILSVLLASCSSGGRVEFTKEQQELFSLAGGKGSTVNEGYNRCTAFVHGWLAVADSATGLIPRNLTDSRDIWNAKDCAADNYPFMVLTCALLDRPLFEGRMKEMLHTEKKLTSRIGSMPDTWSFSKQNFNRSDTVMEDIVFGSAEYVKDGLIPLTEWLGPSEWSERMISIIDDAWKYARLDTPYGKIVSDNPEVNGDMLQSLSRIYWITGDRKYLDLAIRLGDYYLLGNNHPTRNFRVLRLRDHGCEIVSGLCELYASVSYADTAKKAAYRKPLYDMLDRILEKGRNSDGLFYNSFDPVKGVPVDSAIADNFGYTLDGFYTVYLLDGQEKYREPVLKALGTLDGKYRNFAWEGKSQDGYADAIEGALNLYVREPVPSTANWLDSEIKVMWAKQQPSGIIEGWHGDGNFARTTIMYCLWKTGGTYLMPWRNDLKIGAELRDSTLYVSISSDAGWKGKLFFDTPRHSEYMHFPLDWPRINQFPEYFTVEKNGEYSILSENKREVIRGSDLSGGYPLSIKEGSTVRLIVSKVSPARY